MANSVITPDQDAVVTEVHIAAPPERVFQALVDPKQVMSWWTSDECQIESFAMETKRQLDVLDRRLGEAVAGGQRHPPVLGRDHLPGKQPAVRDRKPGDRDVHRRVGQSRRGVPPGDLAEGQHLAGRAGSADPPGLAGTHVPGS